MADTLTGGQSLTPGQSITSNNVFFNLVFQADGNLVLYKAFPGQSQQALWASGTDGQGGAFCAMQTDGNLVIYAPGNNPIWSSDTFDHPGGWLILQDDGNLVLYGPGSVALWSTNTVSAVPASGPPASGSQATAGQTLAMGASLQSPNGLFSLIFQSDGNLVLYRSYPNQPDKALWSSDTYGQAAAVCIFQSDGNLVIYDFNPAAIWSSDSYGNDNSTLVVQDDGNVVIYAPGGNAIWATDTVQALLPSGPSANGATAMNPGDILLPGESIHSPNNQFQFAFQTDGNFVLYRIYPNHPSKALWWSDTYEQSAALCILQSDGNLVIYDFDAQALWSSNSYGNDNSTLVLQDDGNAVIYAPGGNAIWATDTVQALLPSGPSANGATMMNSGDILLPGESIHSPNNQFQFAFQTDGNFVWYDLGAGGQPNAVWASGTDGQIADLCIMQIDGNLVLYDPDANALWASGTDGNPGSRLIAQDDGNAVVSTPEGGVVWDVFSALHPGSTGLWAWVDEAAGTAWNFAVRLVGGVADIAGAVFSLILAIPILGGIIRAAWNWGTEIFWRFVGLFDFGLSLLGARPRKRMSFGIIIPKVDGAAIATPAQLQDKVDGAIATFDRLCNIDLQFSGFAVFGNEPPSGAMTPSCNASGFFADWFGDFGLVGSWYELATVNSKFDGGWRKIPGYGSQIIAFVVQDVRPNSETSSKVGCSFAATHDYIVFEATSGSQVIAHEMGHACLLGHRSDDDQNLMFTLRLSPSPTLTGWQISVIRSSRHCTYL